MAKKMNTLRVPQEARRQAAVMNRQPAPLNSVLYLTQLRQQTLKVQPFKRRLQISVEAAPQLEVPRRVKIIQVGQNQDTLQNGEAEGKMKER